MKHAETSSRRRGIGIGNWLGTLFLCCIPGVNIIALIITGFAAKTRSKRNFAWASLLLTLIFIVLFIAAFAIFGDSIVEWAKNLNA